MDVCHSAPSFLENIDGAKLIYILTTISFAIVFIFIAVLNRFTVLVKLGLPNANTPKFPFGNLSEVVFQNVAPFFHLWKYYNKFKRKGRKVGGFYAFLRPCVVPVDACVFDQLLKIESASESSDPVFDLSVLRKYFESEKYKSVENLFRNQLKNGENPKFDEILQNYLIKNILNLLSRDEEDQLQNLLTLSAYNKNYSGFRKHFSQFHFSESSSNNLTKKLNQIQLNRKKNDVKSDDLINSLIKYLNQCSKEHSKQVLIDFVNTLSDIINYSLSTVYFCLNELHLNPEIQQELIDEIRRFKKDDDKNENDFEKLLNFKYLSTVVKETLRKYPPCGYLVKKLNSPFVYTEKDDKEIQIPANFFVLFSIFGLHHNSENYANPKEFDPDRFSEENEKFIKDNKYLPLGKINKNCKNEHQIIIFFVKKIVMMILSTYKVKISKKGLPYLDYDPTKISPCPEMPFLFCFEEISENLVK